MKKLFVIAACLLPVFSAVANVQSPNAIIAEMISYADYGDGDVYIRLQNNDATCSHGYYLNKAQVGFNANFSMLVAAYQAKQSVIIHADPNQRWAGSSSPTCKVYSVSYQQ